MCVQEGEEEATRGEEEEGGGGGDDNTHTHKHTQGGGGEEETKQDSTNIFAEYDTGHKVKIGGELFDSRGYLQKPNSSTSTTEVNALELGQAYLKFDLSDDTGMARRAALPPAGSRRTSARAASWRVTTSVTPSTPSLAPPSTGRARTRIR